MDRQRLHDQADALLRANKRIRALRREYGFPEPSPYYYWLPRGVVAMVKQLEAERAAILQEFNDD